MSDVLLNHFPPRFFLKHVRPSLVCLTSHTSVILFHFLVYKRAWCRHLLNWTGWTSTKELVFFFLFLFFPNHAHSQKTLDSRPSEQHFSELWACPHIETSRFLWIQSLPLHFYWLHFSEPGTCPCNSTSYISRNHELAHLVLLTAFSQTRSLPMTCNAPARPFCFHLPSTKMSGTWCHIQLFCGYWGLNSDLSACTETTLQR